jgi:hypothetical protein
MDAIATIRWVCVAIAIGLLPSLAGAQTVTMANTSGTITTGGAAQQLSGAFPQRKGCVVQNQSTGDLWINDQGAAAATQPSIKVPAGAQFVCGGYAGGAPGGAMSIFGATTGQAFAGREW